MFKRRQYLETRTFVSLIFAITVWLAVGCQPSNATPTPIKTDPGPQECDDRIAVVVWGDKNGDGLQDPGEPPLPDVALRVVPKDDTTGQGFQLSTGDDGKANFPMRELENCQTRGYQLLFLVQATGYEFPSRPVVDLDDFDPDVDVVYFGLPPESESEG